MSDTKKPNKRAIRAEAVIECLNDGRAVIFGAGQASVHGGLMRAHQGEDGDKTYYGLSLYQTEHNLSLGEVVPEPDDLVPAAAIIFANSKSMRWLATRLMARADGWDNHAAAGPCSETCPIGDYDDS